VLYKAWFIESSRTGKDMSNPKMVRVLVLTILAISGSGCDDGENSRVAKVALEAAQHQAEQNQEMSRLNREVAQGTRQVVERQAVADQQWQAREQNLQKQSDNLESERHEQAIVRQRDSLLAPVFWTLGVLLVCALPLLICWKLLTGLEREIQGSELSQMLRGTD
jgi:hypothetical protein